MEIKTKSKAASLFGSKSALADALGITRQAVNGWPEKLTERQSNEVTGAALKAGKLTCQAEITAA